MKPLPPVAGCVMAETTTDFDSLGLPGQKLAALSKG
jgi:hypothetical protein